MPDNCDGRRLHATATTLGQHAPDFDLEATDGKRYRLADIGGDTLLPQGLARLRDLDLGSLPRVAEPVRLGACVAQVGKFVCMDSTTSITLPSPA